MICDYITASPWCNVILCKVFECHRSTSPPWKGLSHTSPWISTQSIQCEVVRYIILTSSLPLSASDHNHSKYLVSKYEMYLGCVGHFPTDLAWATACYTKDVVYKNSFACAFNDNYWAVDGKSTQWSPRLLRPIDRLSAVFSICYAMFHRTIVSVLISILARCQCTHVLLPFGRSNRKNKTKQNKKWTDRQTIRKTIKKQANKTN